MSAQYISGSSIRDNGQAPALALERQAIGTDDENQQLEHALLHTSTSGDGDTLDHHTPEENEHDDANDNDHSSKSDNDDEFAEEDAWLVAGHFLSDDDDDNDNDSERYVPQLMDTREMCELRSTLRKSERQIATCGRLREFVPRKPAASPEHRGGKRVVSGMCRRDGTDASASSVGHSNTTNDSRLERLQQNHDGSWTSGPTRAFLTAAPSTAAIGAQDVPQSARRSRKQEDFAVVLRRELRQLRGASMCLSVLH